MPYLYLIRHPRTHVDPTRPSHEWGLSEQGRAQLEVLSDAPFCKYVTAICASNQLKALEPARAIGGRHGVPVTVMSELAEVGRGTEAYLSASDYESALSRFFSSPEKSIAGWERATDALDRFQGAIHEIVRLQPNQSVAIVSHAMVLTLFSATLANEAPTLARWHDIGFATIAVVDTDTMQLVTPFIGAPYTGVPLP